MIQLKAPGDSVRTTPPPAPSTDVVGRRARLGLVTAALVTVVGVAAAVGSKALRLWTALGPGPGFFPLCLGVLLAVLGSAWFVAQLRANRSRVAVVPGEPETDEDEVPEYSLPTVVAILASLCALAATLEVLGYQLAMFLFLLFHLLVLGRRRLLLSLVIALVGSVGVFVAFTRLLGVPLPAASVPFLAGLGL
jgi:putative tricarboxylic transport membrane protein